MQTPHNCHLMESSLLWLKDAGLAWRVTSCAVVRYRCRSWGDSRGNDVGKTMFYFEVGSVTELTSLYVCTLCRANRIRVPSYGCEVPKGVWSPRKLAEAALSFPRVSFCLCPAGLRSPSSFSPALLYQRLRNNSSNYMLKYVLMTWLRC